ncbi:hypothetical protein AMJ85_11890 [candidate division BRC1 bacterium SM23_51]|nr:MAG: hypothetical protein AMJ85_11890 [candidate division BRC1 bacterium SM23_51]
MATTTILESTLSQTLREELLPSIYERGVIKDPVYAMARRTWSNVVRNEGIGRDYKVKKVWGMGLAGGGSFGSPLGSDMINDSTWSFSAFGTPETWPGYDEVSAPTFLTSEVQLVKHKLNLFVPRDILQADRLNSSIGAVMPFYVRGLSKLALQQELGTFYSTLPTTVALASIGDASSTVTDGPDTSSINIDLSGASSSGATGRIHRLEKGQLVDLYKSDGTVKRNTNFLIFVDNVDYETQVVRLRRIDGGELQDSTTLGGGINYDSADGDGDIIVLKDSIGFTPGTMAAWVADGTTITDFFGITVTNHGEYKSILRDLSDAPLTESLLNRYVGYFKESFRDGDLPRAVTTNGVLLGFIDNIDANVQGATEASTVMCRPVGTSSTTATAVARWRFTPVRTWRRGGSRPACSTLTGSCRRRFRVRGRTRGSATRCSSSRPVGQARTTRFSRAMTITASSATCSRLRPSASV